MRLNATALKFALFASIPNLIFTPIFPVAARPFGYAAILLFWWSALEPIVRTKKIIISKTVLAFAALIMISLITSIGELQDLDRETITNGLISLISFVVFYQALSQPLKGTDSLTLENVFHGNYALCAMFILYTFGPFGFKMMTVNEYGKQVFSMGLGNPNGVSMLVMVSIIYLILHIADRKKRIPRIIDGILILGLSYSLYLLSSRTAVFCCLAVLAFFVLKMDRIERIASRIVLFFPILMILFQLNISQIDFGFEIFGKAIDTGRSEIYHRVLETMRGNPIHIILGNLCENWFYNAHNCVLTILFTLGLIGVILFLGFWNHQFAILRRVSKNKLQKIAFFAVIVFMIHASAESMAVIGTVPYSIHVVIIMKIAKGEIVSRHDRAARNRVPNAKDCRANL